MCLDSFHIMKKDQYRKIRAWKTGWLLEVTDWLCVVPGLELLARKTSASLTMEMSATRDELKQGALFLSNHRDIVMDAAWLSLLLRKKLNIRPFMGVGNNLYGRWWIEPFFRLNRGFTVIRGGNMRDILRHSQSLSGYIHLLRSKHKSIWLAQREGRAKDGNDTTQHAIIKMLAMGEAEGSLFDAIHHLNICPLCINYEFDPCDYLKAQEMQLKRDNPEWKKSREDDILSMKTGVKGQKGRVVYRVTAPLNRWLDAHREEIIAMPKNQQIEAIANQIDKQIHSAYEIYERGKAFDEYIESRLRMINIPNKDEQFLRERLYEMYNNPVKNYEKSHLSGEF